MSAVLEIDGLSVAYGGIPALSGASLRVEAGSIVTVIATAVIWPQLLKFGSLIDARPEEPRGFEVVEVKQEET